nr:fasciclin-like arabinogalactan protein 1 [Ipomoea batatas]GMD19213.1 fasciclin-like arabinogalactan protein 1 [Ipomoea batatas]
MADLFAKHHSIYTIKNILSFHVLLDYYGAKKLHQLINSTALAATMFQTTGFTPGAAGFVNITDLKGEKAVELIPYNISIIHISSVLPSAVAEVPAPEPSKANITKLIRLHCRQQASVDVKMNGKEEKGDEGVNDNGEATDLHGAVLHHFIPSRKLKEQAWPA